MQLDHHLARMSPAPTSEVLNRAADLIEERGWTDGVMAMNAESSVPVCLEGALSAILDLGIVESIGGILAHRYPDYRCQAYRAVHDYLALDDWQRLFDWNDEPGRTGEQVVEVLRACAVIEASREREPAAVSA